VINANKSLLKSLFHNGEGSRNVIQNPELLVALARDVWPWPRMYGLGLGLEGPGLGLGLESSIDNFIASPSNSSKIINL